MIRTIFPLIALSFVLTGCLGAKNFRVVDDVKVVDIIEEKGIPEWYIKPQPDNAIEVFGTGTGLAEDIQFSMDKAYHQAKVSLGDKLSAVVSSEMISTISETNSRAQKVSKSGYEGIDVSKYSVSNKVVFKEGNMYRTYVQLRIERSEAIVFPEIELEDKTITTEDNQ
jgi:hypothetical protein